MVKITTLNTNHVVVHDKGVSILFSYDTPICAREVDNNIILYAAWDYSATTSKFRKQFLNGETTAETRKKMMAGVYTLRRAYAKDK